MEYKRLSDVANVIVGYPFKSEQFNTMEDGIKLVRGKNIGKGFLHWEEDARWWSDFSINLDKYYLKNGDIVIGMDGSNVGKNFAVIQEKELPLLLVQRVACVRAKENFSQDFLKYCVMNPNFTNYVQQVKTGSAIPHISASQIYDYRVPCFDLEIQEKIVKVLNCISDKIELNNQINNTLKMVCKEYYLHLIEKDFKEVYLGELMSYQGGSQPPASEFQYESSKENIRFVQIRDFDNNEYLCYVPISSKNKTCQKDDILIARYGASLGRICYGLAGAYNVALAKVLPKEEIYKEMLRTILESKNFHNYINNVGQRSAQAGFNADDIQKYKVKIPSCRAKIIEYNSFATKCLDRRLLNMENNNILINLKNILLSKLMNGEIVLDKIEV